jgi:NADPH:quinone reductase-like Zn-dependent oxidoreductase
MKAVIQTKHGSPKVLQLKEIEIPQPEDNEVLIKNYGSSINTVDVFYRGGVPKLTPWVIRIIFKTITKLTKPKRKIPGCGFAGEIVSIGSKVVDWKVGDHVFGYSHEGGACAEYMTVPITILAKKPSNLSFLEAAAVPGGASPALVTFRDIARPKKGQKVLVIAASGGIGTFGVQIARYYGAHVTGVCGPTNLDMVKEIGADNVIDYKSEDYTKIDYKFDIIFDAIGANTFAKCKKILTDKGIYVTTNPVIKPRNIFSLKANNPLKKRFIVCQADDSAGALNLIREWIENGKIRPVIDTVYPLSQTADAHRHYETGHSKGRVVISID